MAVREAISQSNRSTLEPKNGTGYNVFGLFSHGNMSGITRKSHELPWLCKYVNLFGKHHLAQEGSCWTSFAVNFNQPMNIHLDPNNDPGSSNFTCSFGDFKGGQLWVELTEDSDPSVSPVRWKTKRNGQRVPGHLHTTQHRFIQFSPKSFHATDRWSGTRISLTFYSSRLIAQSTEARRECLKKLGFPLPRSVRPLKYDDNEGEDAYAVDPVEGQGAGEVLLCQDVRHLLQASCEEVWDEVNSLLDVHGRDPHCLQVDVIELTSNWNSEARLSHGSNFRKVLRNVISLSQQQLRGGECVWVSEKHSSAWRDRDSCQFWQTLAESGKAFEWQHGDLQIRTTSKAMFLDCSRVSSKMESVENQWDYLYRAFCGSVMNFHGASSASGEGNPVYAVTAQKEALEGVDKKELESLLDTVQKLHRRFGHPSNSLLLKNLRARGASPKLLAVAAEFKCDMCMENQIRTSAPAVSLKREDRLWCTLQIDGFYMRIGQEVFHYLLMVDEASGFCVVEEMIRHPEKEMRHMTTAQVCRTLELRWCQIFGFPETIKLDPEGAFRGLDLGEYCSSRGIELSVIPAEYHEGISEVERSIGTIRRKIEAFMRQEQYHPTRAAAQMVAAHNTMARTLGFSPAQWAFGRDVTVTGHSRERPGEVCAQSAMSDPSHGMAESLELRTRAEKAFIEARAREVMSRAMNSRTRPAKRFLPGDIIFYQRFQVPQDAPANSVVDRPRMGIARFYGPARVLATETRVVSEEGVRKPSAIVWAVCNGRLKRFHQSQVRHSTESERLIAEGAAGAEFPWTFASLASLLDRGSFDDETIVRSRTRGRSKTPARSRSVPPGRRAAPEPPVLPPQLHYGPEPEAEDFEEEEEMIPVPAEMSRGSKRPDPEPPHDDEAEMIPVPQAHNSLVENLDMSRFLNDPQYLPANFVTLDQEESESSAYVIQNASCASLQDESPAFAVTLAAPSSEAEWKALVKNPKRFIAKSVQKGVEVSYAKLNGVQRAAMDEAMKVEVDNWMKTQAVRAVQKFLPQRELLKMRWVLTFKSAPDESAEPKDGQPASDSPKASGERIKAKARIVILGYSDPNLLEANTVSPAMSRLSRQLLLNMASVRKWDILCGDVKSAFLQAKSPQGQRCVFAAPVPELARALGLQEGQAVQLLRSCYGLVSAPREWYEDVHRTLVSLGAERLTTDSCVWRIRDASGAVVGLVSSHVDDFLMTGCSSSKAWQDFLHGFKNAYEWSPWEHGAFRHCGVNIMQHPDHSVSLDHSSFCQELKQLDPIREERKLTLAEVSQVRAVLGSVQWRVYQSAPQHAAKLNYLQSLIASQDSSIVEQVNKLIREVYSARSLSVQVQSLGAEDPEQLCMIAWSDASLANRPDFSSTGGHLIALMHQQSLEAGMGRINPIAWKSGRLHRIARSSLSAESQALADTEQELFFARLEWREMIGDYVDAKVPENTAAKVPSYLVVDAKAMFDTLSKGVFVASQKDKYTGLELLSLSQHLEKQKTVLLWCDSNHMLADGLTKASKQDVLKRFLASGYWRIRYDGAFISAKKRRQMLREPAAENVTNSVFLQCTEQAQALKCFGILPGGMSEDLYKSVLPPPSSACKHSVLTSRSSFGPRLLTLFLQISDRLRASSAENDYHFLHHIFGDNRFPGSHIEEASEREQIEVKRSIEAAISFGGGRMLQLGLLRRIHMVLQSWYFLCVFLALRATGFFVPLDASSIQALFGRFALLEIPKSKCRYKDTGTWHPECVHGLDEFVECEYNGYQYSMEWYFMQMLRESRQYLAESLDKAEFIYFPQCVSQLYFALRQSYNFTHWQAIERAELGYLVPILRWAHASPAHRATGGLNFWTVFSMDLGRQDFPRSAAWLQPWSVGSLTGSATWTIDQQMLHKSAFLSGPGYKADSCWEEDTKPVALANEMFPARSFYKQDTVISIPSRFSPHPRSRRFGGRTVLGFFAGSPNSCARKRVLAALAAEPGFDVSTSFAKDDENYRERMWRARFCFVLRGSSHTNNVRLYDVMAHGCVPVVVSDDFQAPLDRLLPWREMAIFLPTSSIPRLAEILRHEITEADRWRYFQNIALGSPPGAKGFPADLTMAKTMASTKGLDQETLWSGLSASKVFEWHESQFWMLFYADVASKLRDRLREAKAPPSETTERNSTETPLLAAFRWVLDLNWRRDQRPWVFVDCGGVSPEPFRALGGWRDVDGCCQARMLAVEWRNPSLKRPYRPQVAGLPALRQCTEVTVIQDSDLSKLQQISKQLPGLCRRRKCQAPDSDNAQAEGLADIVVQVGRRCHPDRLFTLLPKLWPRYLWLEGASPSAARSGLLRALLQEGWLCFRPAGARLAPLFEPFAGKPQLGRGGALCAQETDESLDLLVRTGPYSSQGVGVRSSSSSRPRRQPTREDVSCTHSVSLRSETRTGRNGSVLPGNLRLRVHGRGSAEGHASTSRCSPRTWRIWLRTTTCAAGVDQKPIEPCPRPPPHCQQPASFEEDESLIEAQRGSKLMAQGVKDGALPELPRLRPNRAQRTRLPSFYAMHMWTWTILEHIVASVHATANVP
ncbi:RE1 [Symbiodinium natans]|uniref:RE1 protein n=1 Tax=Symbiodinium natans TaxID=878477 RepID=A0A812QWG5_9DINO|nr:RE1 [Symbiodinium natans]